VILSLQLPFAVIPLIHFTNNRERMGEFANRPWVKVLAWAAAVIILALNMRLVAITVGEWLTHAGSSRGWLELLLIPALAGLAFLLLWVLLEPMVPAWRRRFGRAPVEMPFAVAADLPSLSYRKILVPLDHTDRDRAAIAHAASLAHSNHATIYLLHVEEGVTSQVYGPLASTAEVLAGDQYLAEIAKSLDSAGVKVETVVRHSRKPRTEIVEYAQELQPDLIVMGAHGHKGLKDIIFGTTINAVRHKLKIPLLVVR
jgi:manganese transport protein